MTCDSRVRRCKMGKLFRDSSLAHVGRRLADTGKERA